MDKIVFHSAFGGRTVERVNSSFKNSLRELITPETPAPVRIFATGVGRQDFHTVGGKLSGHAVVDATLEEVYNETGKEIVLTYLPGAQEASFGFDTMLEHSLDVLERAIVDCGIAADVPEVGVIQSGNGSTQVGVFVRSTKQVYNLNAFDFGTQNKNTCALEAFAVWMGNQVIVKDFISFGSESYAVPKGKIATNHISESNPLHSGVDESARAAGAVMQSFDIATSLGKNYYVPERKTWDVKTSATLSMRKMYPDGTILDWGSGQIKNDETGVKITFDQREIFGTTRA